MAVLKALVLGAFLAFASLPALAASPISPTLTEAERGIQDSDPEPLKHLRIDELLVTAKVTGRTADIALDLLISSDSPDPYEAKLALSLPSDAVVTGYALNAGKTMIAGQLLEQPKARNVYEDEVRAGIDPGLAEVSAGNQFTTRIYPIDTTNPRRIRISFSAPFDPATGIVLPFYRYEAIKKVAFSIAISGYDTPPAIHFAGKSVSLSRDGKGWRGAVTEQSPLREGLSINGGTLVSPIIVTRHSRGERFFLISDAAGVVAKPRPGRLRIYWDRSRSHGSDNLALESDTLSRVAEATAPTAIDLVTFASDRPTVSTFGDVASLRKALASVVYRGGTSLAGLDAVTLPPATQCVIVFDGIVTIDRGIEFAPDCALSILTSSKMADGSRLGRLAQSTAGQLVRVAEGREAEAAAALSIRTSGVASVREGSGKRIAFRSLPAHSGQWQLVGPLPERGSVRVRLNDGSERTYFDSSETAPSDAPGALWAAQQVQALGDDPSRHEAMVDFARRYGVAGPAMSLLVLERPDQYVRAGIVPPAGFDADWMSDYRTQKKDHDAEALDARHERFDFVLNAWKERKAWWNKRFVARRQPARLKGNAIPAPPALVMAPPPAPAPAITTSSPRSQSSSSAGGYLAPDDAAEMIVTAQRRSDVPVARNERSTENAEIKLDLADLTAKRPYIAALASASAGNRLGVLRSQEQTYGALPSFYLDTAEWFRLKGDLAASNLLLLSALELPLTDDETRQIVAFRLERDKSYDRAVELTAQIAAANADFRPQPARDLALALAARGRNAGSAGRTDLERAFKLLIDAALNPASSDFDGFEVVALMEANALTTDIDAVGGNWELDPRLTGVLDTDVRIVMEWTADDADIDLWVDEPNGERVYYGNQFSSAGGQISNDMTDGYGPEEYAIRRAPAGTYGVRVNGYDADRLNPNGPGHVLLRLIRNFSRAAQRDMLVDLDLSFQQGRNRDTEDKTKPVATLNVDK
ncbi:MAG TPA: VIT domain-containing protein [Sphingobium sp.]